MNSEPLNRTQAVEALARPPQQLAKRTVDHAISLTPYRAPASAEDALARQAAAAIEREEGFDRCAQLRLHGSYDGDSEHRIALKAIELFKLSTREAGGANNAPASNQ